MCRSLATLFAHHRLASSFCLEIFDAIVLDARDLNEFCPDVNWIFWKWSGAAGSHVVLRWRMMAVSALSSSVPHRRFVSLFKFVLIWDLLARTTSITFATVSKKLSPWGCWQSSGEGFCEAWNDSRLTRPCFACLKINTSALFVFTWLCFEGFSGVGKLKCPPERLAGL